MEMDNFFIPLVIIIGTQKFIDAPLGREFRVYFDAFLFILGKILTLFIFSDQTLSFSQDH